MSKKIHWHESQECVGCKHGCFLMNEPESSVYICDKGLENPVEMCHEPDVSNTKDLDTDCLQDMENIFFERKREGLDFSLTDFTELQLELERRSNK